MKLTIPDIITWLATLPPDTVVYFDSFERSHCLISAYYQAMGIAASIEYGQAIERYSHKELATFDHDLQVCLYSLHSSPLRWTPSAASLLSHLSTTKWDSIDLKNLPMFFYRSDEEMNQLFDSPLRPVDVNWRHWETITIEGNIYRTMVFVVAPTETYKPDILHNLPYTIFVYHPPRLMFQLVHRYNDGRAAYGVPYTAGRVGTLSGLEKGARVDLLQACPYGVLASWVNNGDGKLTRSYDDAE